MFLSVWIGKSRLNRTKTNKSRTVEGNRDNMYNVCIQRWDFGDSVKDRGSLG